MTDLGKQTVPLKLNDGSELGQLFNPLKVIEPRLPCWLLFADKFPIGASIAELILWLIDPPEQPFRELVMVILYFISFIAVGACGL